MLACIGISASAYALETGEAIYPTIGAAWEFSESPLQLRQVRTREAAPRALLRAPASVSFKDGKGNRQLAAQAERLISQTADEIVMRQDLASVDNGQRRIGVEAVHDGSSGRLWRCPPSRHRRLPP